MSFRTRNVKKILEEESNIFSRLGMVKQGYEGFEPTLLTGGKVWYIAYFPQTPNELHTLAFESWFGNIRQTYQRFLNPKILNK